jgi:SAM-dependent methyltransferase
LSDYAPHRPARVPHGRLWAWRRALKRVALAAGRGYPAALSPAARLAGRLLACLAALPLQRVPAWVAGGRLLDAGCGNGSYVAAMRALGWDALGLEPALEAALLGERVVVGRIERAPLAGASCDVITLWHVLEHTASPAAALAEARRLLRAGGALLLEVPDIGSFQARLFGRRWLHLDPPRHRYHFTRRTLRAYLQRAGFIEIRIWSAPSPVGIAGSLGMLLGRTALAESRLARALCWPAAGIEALAGRGGCLRAAARRGDEHEHA